MRALPPGGHGPQLTLPGVIEVTPTSLVIDPDTPRDEWVQIGATLSRIESGYQWWIGDWWAFGDQAYEERKQVLEERDDLPSLSVCENAGWVAKAIDPSRRLEDLSFTHHLEVASLEPEKQDYWLGWALDTSEDGGATVDEETGEITPASTRELKTAIRKPRNVVEPPPPEPNTYHTFVVDPPWEIEKIARDVRPAQKAMDYPSIADEELCAWGEKHLVPAARDDAHLYLWTTHKKLPLALDLVESWGFNYQCVLTWVKNVGFTPFSWMYSTELIIFARRGNLDLLKLGRRLDFSAKVREHSRKPDVFYDLVREVSPGPRLDMFSRERRDGFDTWGADEGQFDELAS